MDQSPLVAVVIVHWGSSEMTMECIRSVLACHYANLRIVVVDNCPERRLWQNQFEADHTVVYIQSMKNTGYCGGNNLGISQAQKLGPRYILLLNNDTVVDQDMLRKCVAYMEAHPDVSVISPKVLFYKAPQYIEVAGGKLDPNTGRITVFGKEEKDVGQCDKEKEITWATGCAVFAREHVFEQIGLFDETLFCYSEDVDISRRIVLEGLKIKYLPSVIVWHKHGGVTLSGKAQLPSRGEVYYTWRNNFYNLRRYLSEGLAREYIRFLCRFVWSLASFAIKHQRIDLSLAMLIGLFDSIARRMGRRDYWLLDPRRGRTGK